MNTFCKNIGVYAPNTRLKSTSCYLIQRKNKLLILDAGYGVKDEIINYIVYNNVLPGNIMIVVSHNHLDHVVGLYGIGEFMLKYYPCSKIKLLMSDTSEKYHDWYNGILKRYHSVFDVTILDQKLEFYFNDLMINFCKTNHCEDKIKSFATKISCGNKSFVYTSDIASVDNALGKFIKDVDVVMVDGGNPIKRHKTLAGYHGVTSEIVYDILNCSVNEVYLTHLKACFSIEDYINSLYSSTKNFVSIARQSEEFDIFTGKTKQIYSSTMTSLA